MSLLADAYLREWLDLLLRWLHVIAGMVWIGTSFYFVALDSHLRPSRGPGGRRRVVGDPRRRLLQRAEVPGRAGEASGAPALVQVGGVHDLAERVRAPRRPLLPRRRHVPGGPRRRRSRHGLGGRDQRRLCSLSPGSSTTFFAGFWERVSFCWESRSSPSSRRRPTASATSSAHAQCRSSWGRCSGR